MLKFLDRQGINSVHTIKAREAEYGPFPPKIAIEIIQALKRNGINRLYAHQSDALKKVLDGMNVIVTTGTSSGKSLVYTIPIFNELINHKNARGLYISPAKALGQNQMKTMHDLAAKINWPQESPIMTSCDGDTPYYERRDIINSANVIITTPDFIHACLLPKHHSWPGFFGGLRYVIIDEAHVLKGVMGCHCLQVFRRLRRICNYYGSHPVFILCTATIANPKEFAGNLVGLDFESICNETSAAGQKTVVFYEPPTYESDDGKIKRRLTHFEGARALGRYVHAGRRTIMFCRSRRIVESAYRKIRESFPDISHQITTYKGTYAPEMRRDIESKLFAGKLKGVITTNALELGINVGELDTCILAGFAGSVSSTWQQAGRVGRNGQESLIVLIANEDPLDFYLVRHPHYFFGQSFEKAIVSEKMQFLVDHLPLAAAELPLKKEDTLYWNRGIYYEAVKLLLKHKRLRLATGHPKTYCSAGNVEFFGLRGESENYHTVDPEGRILEQYNYDDVLRDAYPGAILPVYNRVYQVDEIDLATKTIKLKNLPRQLSGCFTRSDIKSQIDIQRIEQNYESSSLTANLGVLSINKNFVGYVLVDIINEKSTNYEPKCSLKPINFHTVGIWLDISLNKLTPSLKYEAVHALKHLLHIIVPLEVMCERTDLGASMMIEGDNAKIFIYDNYAGGIGLCESAFTSIKKVMERCYELVTSCTCLQGCPSCIIIPQCLQANERLSKEGVVSLLSIILGKEPPRPRIFAQNAREKTIIKPKSRTDIKMEARELEMEIKSYKEVLEHVQKHLSVVKDCIKNIYGKKFIKQEIQLIAIFYLMHDYTGKPIPTKMFKYVVTQHVEWSAMYRLSLRQIKDRGLIMGPEDRLVLLPGLKSEIDKKIRGC